MTTCRPRPDAVRVKHPVRPIRSSVCTILQPGCGLIPSVRAKRSGREPQETTGGETVQAVAPFVEKPSVALRGALAEPPAADHERRGVATVDRDQCPVKVVAGAVCWVAVARDCGPARQCNQVHGAGAKRLLCRANPGEEARGGGADRRRRLLLGGPGGTVEAPGIAGSRGRPGKEGKSGERGSDGIGTHVRGYAAGSCRGPSGRGVSRLWVFPVTPLRRADRPSRSSCRG